MENCGRPPEFDAIAGCLMCPKHGPVSQDGGLDSRDVLAELARDEGSGEVPF